MDLKSIFGPDGIVINQDFNFGEGSHLNDLTTAMQQAGLLVTDIDTSGDIVRVKVNASAGHKADTGQQKSGWYVVNVLGQHFFATFGNWKTGEEHKWSTTNANKLTPQEFTTLQTQMAQQQARRQELEIQRQHEAAVQVSKEFAKMQTVTAHPYLQAKQIPSHGLKQDSQGNLVVPVRSVHGDLCSWQTITGTGQKKFYPGGKVKGNIFLLGAEHTALANLRQLYICEGYATASSIYAATKLPVACVFSANFGKTAVQELRKVNTDMKIYIALDADTSNVGQRAAQDIADAFPHCYIRIPSKFGDYNDMHITDGLAAVRTELLRGGMGITRYAIRNLINEPPPRVWLVDKFVEASKPALLASIGGVGKSMLALDLCLKVSRGSGTWFGHDINSAGNSVFISAEDDQNEIHRRLVVLDPNKTRLGMKEDVYAYTIPDTGKPLILVQDNAQGLNLTQQADELLEELSQIPDLKLVVLDPIQAMSAAPLSSSNEAAQLFMQLCSSIAAQFDCVCLSIHHMNKAALSSNGDAMSARQAIRGASALVDASRNAIALWLGDKDEAERVCLDAGFDYEPLRAVQGGIVKSNSGEVDMQTQWLIRKDAVLEPITKKTYDFGD